MFMQAYIQKLKPKLKFAFTLAFAITLLLLTQHPITAKASDINLMGVDDSKVIGGGTGTNASKDYIDNAGPSKTGWLIYLSDKDGNIVSDKVVYQNAERTSLPKGYRLDYLNTRFSGGRLGLGKKVTHFAGGAAKWGAPFDSKNKSRQAEIYAYLDEKITIEGRTGTRAFEIVYRYLGADAAKLFLTQPKDHYLVMEACAYHEVLTATHSSKLGSVGELQRQLHLATSYGWMQIEQSQGCDLYGNIDSDVYWYKGADVSWCDNKILQISCMLSNKWPGLPDVPTVFSEDECGRLSYTTVLSVGGYGMLAVRGQEQDMIHTYWEPHGSPGDPEPNTGTGQAVANDNGSTSKGDKKGKCNIVKCYYVEKRVGDEVTYTDKTDGYNTLECTNVVSIDNEPNDYKLEAWKVSTSLDTGIKAVTGGAVTWYDNIPGSIKQEGTSEEIVTIEDNQTVYVLLKKIEDGTPTPSVDANYIIRESQITKRISLSTQDSKALSEKLSDHTFKWQIAAHANTCSGHSVTVEKEELCSNDCQRLHECKNGGCAYAPTDTKKETCIMVGKYEYYSCGNKHKKETTETKECCSGFAFTDDSLTFGITNTKKDDYPSIITDNSSWREIKNGEAGTVDQTRSSMDTNLVYEIKGWDYVAVLLRGKDELTVADWKNSTTEKDHLKAGGVSSVGFNVGNTPTGRRKQSDYFDSFSAEFGGRYLDNKQTITTAQTKSNGYTGDPCTDTKNYSFLGSTSLAFNDIGVLVETYSGKAKLDKGSTTKTPGGNLVASGETISFYPYIKMRYDTLNKTDKTAYVLGEYKRDFTPCDYVSVSIKRADGGTIAINSAQWSTHAQATADHGIESVLPGGAMLSLTTPEDKQQAVIVRTQQVILKDEGLTQVEETKGSGKGLTEDQAKANHQQLVNSVRSALENVYITQFVKAEELRRIMQAEPGSDLSFLKDAGLKGKASTDNKYYFRADGMSNGIGEGDLDTKIKPTTTKYNKYWTEPTSSEVKSNTTFTDYTGTKDLLGNAVENGTGEDSTADWGPAWYNEAFDGVYVMEQTTVIEVAFFNPEERTSILDPKLTPESNGKEDMFKSYITSYYESTGSSRVGSFKGKQINLDMSKLYHSKKFYIPNVTTQDLN